MLHEHAEDAVRDIAPIKAAYDELMMVAAKYDLTGFFYISQLNNEACKNGFFQKTLAIKPGQMHLLASDLNNTVHHAVMVLFQAIMRAEMSMNMVVKAEHLQEVRDDMMQEAKERLLSWIEEHAEGTGYVAAVQKDPSLYSPDDMPTTSADLERMQAEGSVKMLDETKVNRALINRLRQIALAVVGEYYVPFTPQPESSDQ